MELRTEDLTLHYEDDGDRDAPPVLLLHGITQSTATWGWVVPHLAKAHRVVRLDFRGHGRSGRTPGAYGFPGYVADATAILEHVLGRAAVVIGHSLGGGTAAAIAQGRPDLLRGVVLEDPPLYAPRPAALSELGGNSLLGGFRLMRESVPRLQSGGISVADLTKGLGAAPSPTGPTFAELVHPDALEAMAEGMLLLDATVLDPVLDGSMSPLFDPTRELPVPGILLAADPARPDAVVRPGDVALLQEHSPQVECRVIAGASHLIHDSKDHRDAVLRGIDDLLARVG